MLYTIKAIYVSVCLPVYLSVCLSNLLVFYAKKLSNFCACVIHALRVCVHAHLITITVTMHTVHYTYISNECDELS